MDQRIIDLYDDFIHIHFDRRLFIEKAAKIVGGTAAATTLLSMLQSNYARATTIAENDPRVTIEQVTFKGATGDVKGYLAKPLQRPHPPIVVTAVAPFSAGVTECAPTEVTHVAIERADQAMYLAKEAGRARTRVHGRDDDLATTD